VVQTTRAEDADPRIEFFEKKVRPVLAHSCYSCHSAETKPSGELRVDDRNGLLTGGKTGPAIVPGNPEESLLLERIQHENEKRRMPKEGDLLTAEQIADLTTWIRDGAAWPRERIPASLGRTRPIYEELKEKHWAWQPVQAVPLPEVQDTAWPRTDLDRLVLAKLEATNLRPVSDADRVTLIRRITFDLTGLPPTPGEIDAFLAEKSEKAFETVVNRLLASRQFAEHWGRHWLDVARYGESTGPSRNIPYPHAWKYRDYVIDAIDRDIPYDRFIQEQIAGDLLPSDSPAEEDRLKTATGFLALGVKDVNQRFKVRFIMDNVDEKIDTVSRSVLGLTVSCARCHDHKFDPIPVTDYYSLAGIFTSTDDCAGVRNKMGGNGLDYYDAKSLVNLSTGFRPAPPEEVAALEAKVTEAKQAWDAIRGTPEGLALGPDKRPKQRKARVAYEKLQEELLALTDPASAGSAAHGVREGNAVGDTEVRIRGEAERLGPTVTRGFLTTFPVPGAPKVNDRQSGRLELAQWLTSPANPLTARVFVNRTWHHLFGQGIVTTVDNFGVKGDAPSHPELLDYLATRFVSEGWSLKKLIREIVNSRTYQLSSEVRAEYRETDPANRFIWRHSPRRLTSEELRDAMLASAGVLQLTPTEGSPAKVLKMIELRDNGAEAQRLHEQADRSQHRSIYLPLLRGLTPKSLEAFDPVQQTLVTGQRDTTTVPTQALYLLNSSIVRKQALEFAERITASNDRFDREWISEIYVRALSRKPTEAETDRAAEFLAHYSGSYRASLIGAPTEHSPRNAPDEPEPDTTETAVPENPDDVDRTEKTAKELAIQPSNGKAAAWMTLIQAIYASAEFRFVP
jgi:hypothetical protein